MKQTLTRSKEAAWAAFVLVIVVLVATFAMRPVWWSFFDIFFASMAAFCHLVAVMVQSINTRVSGKLDTCALVFIVLAILAFIGEYIAFQVIF